jgi:hypothetical protein
MSKAHVCRGKITSHCFPSLDISFDFSICDGITVALITCIENLFICPTDRSIRVVLPKQSKNELSQIAFLSGEIVPISGIWRPDHDHSADNQDIWLRIQTPFPPCPMCGLAASFSLFEEIVHISEDPDFQ